MQGTRHHQLKSDKISTKVLPRKRKRQMIALCCPWAPSHVSRTARDDGLPSCCTAGSIHESTRSHRILYILHNVTVNNHVKLYLSHFQFSEIHSHFLSPPFTTVQISRNGSGAARGDPRNPQLHWQRRPSNVGSTLTPAPLKPVRCSGSQASWEVSPYL